MVYNANILYIKGALIILVLVRPRNKTKQNRMNTFL